MRDFFSLFGQLDRIRGIFSTIRPSLSLNRSRLFRVALLFLSFSLSPNLVSGEGQSFNIPKIPRADDDQKLLKEIIDSRKAIPDSPVSRQESIRVLGFTQDEKKILFLKRIHINGKRQQDLILFDSRKQETRHYRFNNPILYSRKKKELVKSHDIIASMMIGTPIESAMVRHPLLPADLLFIRENGIRNRGDYPILPSLQISLDNGRERFLLGKIQIPQILTSPVTIEKMLLSTEGRIVVFILTHTYREDNLIHQRSEILGFDLYRAITDPLSKVTADREFALSPEQRKLSFQKNYYYNERDELLYTETLFQSGLKEVSGDYALY